MVQERGHRHSEEQTETLTDKQIAAAKHAGEAATESEVEHEVDDILDEIDEVLERNAEDFVKGYVQKGGQ